MQSIFRYPGGKTKASIQQWIAAHRPPGTKEYREPFVGGGGIFFSLSPAGLEERWINDKHSGLIAVYTALRDRPQDFISRCREIAPPHEDDPLTEVGPRGGKPTNARLQAVFDSLKLNEECDQALRYYVVNRMVHGSGRVNYDIPSRLYFSNPDGWNIVSSNKLEKASDHLQGVDVTSGDYEPLFRDPGESVWIYADPPYVVNGNLAKSSQLYQHGFDVDAHRRFAKVVAECKHKVCISYDDADLVRELFPKDKFRLVEASWRYCGTTNKKKSHGKELLILNYDPETNIRIVVPEVQEQSELALSEANELKALEQDVEDGISGARDSFVKVGLALAKIRDSGKPSQRLYRETHATFEGYCRDRWGINKQRASQLITASARYQALKTSKILDVLPSTESHLSELSRCKSDEQAAEVWRQAVKSEGEKITAAKIRKHVNEAIGYEPPAKDNLASLRNLWQKLTASEREQFLSELHSMEEAA